MIAKVISVTLGTARHSFRGRKGGFVLCWLLRNTGAAGVISHSKDPMATSLSIVLSLNRVSHHSAKSSSTTDKETDSSQYE